MKKVYGIGSSFLDPGFAGKFGWGGIFLYLHPGIYTLGFRCIAKNSGSLRRTR